MGITRATEAFLDAVGQELERALSADGTEQAKVSWQPVGHADKSGPSSEDLHWWSAKFRDGDNWIFAGADAETWRELGADATGGQADNFSVLSGCLETILSREFGPGKVLNDEVSSAGIIPDGTSVTFEIQRAASLHSLYCVLNSGLEAALTESRVPAASMAETARRSAKQPTSGNSLDLLMHVEVPVSVSFGSTRVRMRDLLGLTSGSVVELDQSLGAQVDVRVNDCLIARGEVVAVDGNYAVRVLEIVSPRHASAVNGSTK